ncbi:double-strand break repair helicase AddA [Palleronia caenipelagi]|uniref:DNA 3'-5' helicase n=1 Tax=Palleronia caenipelagi TaxID=2489174 RepID=A0A547Q6P7_9RHOB|nr:double-strand break repair helicase AddA [Palleronia caenipelagi]TRD22044.1 double-strand break repair helicase AddA [Palleronia caenipelagi]
MNDATQRQIAAASPGTSTWLSANAGSGKTRVLTDRVARLLLAGFAPQNILCLTYTKAAASEMQNRLFKRLGEWAMMPDTDLLEALRTLGAEGFAPDDLPRARRLFAQAIETPGGLRIQTIHSFCAVLLRRFPLEAGVSPAFREMDDRSATALRQACLEEMAQTDPDLIRAMALRMGDLDRLARDITGKRDPFARTTPEDIRAALELSPADTADSIRAEAFLGGEADLAEEIRDLGQGVTKTLDGFIADLLSVDFSNPDEADFATLCKLFLYANSLEPRAGKYPQTNHKNARAALEPVLDDLDAWMERVAAAKGRVVALELADLSLLVLRFGKRLLDIYAARKEALGWLDFDDLILGARDLLSKREVADWVLYRLDGGIDQILVDEAQDTSPVQWTVIEALAREFAAGDGTHRTGERTIFVVGDKKQSIYSFQGADPEGFDRMHAHFHDRLGEGGIQRLELQHSFRSAPAVLEAVDAVFADGMGGDDVRHLAFHGAKPGRVDLWPLVEPEPKPEHGDWFDPVDQPSPEDATNILARTVAGQIRQMIDRGEQIPDGKGAHRPVTAGDILILVRRRSGVFAPLIRACKARGIEIAGADTLTLQDDLAVQDLLSLLRFLGLTADDLSLAEALRSPLFGLTEQDLFTLANGREGTLWRALQRSDAHPDVVDTLRDLLQAVDFQRPYELLDRILLRHHGRARLLGRLGQESADAIEALLHQAIEYERLSVPSLTGFLNWFDSEEVRIKRQLDSAGSLLRVMTVHGAKGLEAPVVILPETVYTRPPTKDPLFVIPEGPVLRRPAKPETPPVLQPLLEAEQIADEAERRRLLYVAMTRAESWLIVCGAGTAQDADRGWYGQIEAGLSRLQTAEHETPFGMGQRYQVNDWQVPQIPDRDSVAPDEDVLPDWVHAPPPTMLPRPRILSPSELGGRKVLPGESATAEDGELARQRGTNLHLLLEHLSLTEPESWPADAATLLPDEPPALRHALLSEISTLMDAPGLGALLSQSAMTEVDLVAPHGTGAVAGTVDRLIVTEDHVHAIDYKSNRIVPETVDQVPDGILRQMGAYASALKQIFPGSTVTVSIVWTREARLMEVPISTALAALETVGA